jgi:hypothetical protein
MQNYELFLNMQNICKKKYYFFFFTAFLGAIGVVFSQGQVSLAEADKLFSERKYTRAAAIYEEIRHGQKSFSEQSLLKLAFTAEKAEKDLAKALFYLSVLYEKTKNKQVQGHLIALAQKNALQGYEFGDAAFFAGIYTSYRAVFFVFVIAAFALICFWLFDRVKKGKFNRTAYYIAATAFFASLMIWAFNTNFREPYAIVMHDNTLMYDSPSGGANIIGRLPKGTRLTVGDGRDIWQEVVWNEKVYFVRRHHLGFVIAE